MDAQDPLGKRMQDASFSIILFLKEEGFSIPEGSAVLAMALAAACHEFGIPEREVMGKIAMTVRKMYSRLDKQKARGNHVKTYS